MKKLFFDNFKILFPSIIALIIASLLWDKIKFNFHNPHEIIGYYSIFEYSALNDNVRYIFFIGLPIITYLVSYIYFKKLNIKLLKKALCFDKNSIKKNNISKYYLLSFILIIFFCSISYEFNKNFIDLFHDGQALSGALNFRLNKELWSGSFVVTGLFVDILNANISWKLFEVQSLSSYRLFIEILNLITSFVILIFIFNLVNDSNLKKNLKILFFITLTFIIFFSIKDVLFYYRELPIFLFLYFVHKIFMGRKFVSISCLIIGILPLFALLWSLDRGVFVTAIYIPLLIT